MNTNKPLLTIKETAELYNIGMCHLYEAVKDPDCPYVLRCGRMGKKTLIKREQFNSYINNHNHI